MGMFISRSPEETAELGETWGRAARHGWVIALHGDLGAGKTQLVKGLARGLDIPEHVHSPTFALVNEYSGGRLSLYHLDLYRLETQAQIIGAGLESYLFEPDGVTVVEWAERWFGGPPPAQPMNLTAPRLPSPSPHAKRGERAGERGAPELMGSKPESPARAYSSPSATAGFLRRVWIETLTVSERQITYEDFGA